MTGMERQLHPDPQFRTGISANTRFIILATIFAICLMAGAISVQLAAGAATRGQLLTGAVIQDIIVFALPSVLTAVCISTTPERVLSVSAAPPWRMLLIIVGVYILAYPALDWVICWNESWNLPESIAAPARAAEDAATAATSLMLDTRSAGGLVVNILIVGVLTGVCEELFFRGTVQRMLRTAGMGAWPSIVLSAIIFSALHFQLYGFVPRMLMGIFFGWLLERSGSVWTSAVAHAINNSVVAVGTWLVATGALGAEYFGPDAEPFSTQCVIGSAVATVLLFILVARCRNNNRK